MGRFFSDIKFALRNLRRSPLFTVVAVASLALGIGANTAIFTLVDQLLLRLLPVKNPEQLVMISSTGPHPIPCTRISNGKLQPSPTSSAATVRLSPLASAGRPNASMESWSPETISRRSVYGPPLAAYSPRNR